MSNILEDIKRASKMLEEISGPPVSNGLLAPFSFMDMPIYESPLLTETEEYEETEQLTFHQRWIYPLFHGITEPFQPWVRTRTVTKTRQVPSRKVLQTQFGLIVHPVLKRDILRIINSITT